MSDKLNEAICNLRAVVLIRKLSAQDIALSKTEAIKLLRTNTDNDAFNYAIRLNQNAVSSWVRNRFSQVRNLWRK